MKTLLILIAASMLVGSCWGQTATDLNLGSKLEYNATANEFTFSWWGVDGRTYFIQHSDDMIHWQYLPVLEVGDDNVISWGFTSTSERLFLRLAHWDIPGDPATADTDGDGLSNWNEVQQGLDPFSIDTDGDGISDTKEIEEGSDPLDPANSSKLAQLYIYTRLE